MSDRRQQNERRLAADRRRRGRRRKLDGRVFVIELTSVDLRVAQLERSTQQGADRVTGWATRWRRDAASLDSPEGQAELTAALREVARRYNMFTAEVRVVLSGEYCITRTVRGPIDEVRAELQRLEQRSRLYLSLGPGEKVLVSHTRALDARHAHALAAACNRATLEAVQGAAETAGLEVTMIEPALSALARAASRLPEAPSEPHLLIHFNEGTTEIGVCHQGRLLLDYRPGGATRPGELPALLAGHFNRLNRHVARALRESATELKQVLLCGPAAEVASASGQFERQLGLQTRIVNPADVRATWDLSAAAAEAITAPVLGGLLLSYMPTEEWDAPNLMQHVLAGRQEPLRPRLIASALPLAATLLIAVALMAVNGRHRRVLDGMRAEADSLAVSAARATELRLRLITAEAKLTQLGQLAARLPGALAGEAIRRIGWCLPSDVWLSQVTVAQGTRIRLTGASYLEAGVYDFVRWLELAPGFKEVALKRTSATVGATGPATSFEVELSLGDFNDQAPRMARHD